MSTFTNYRTIQNPFIFVAFEKGPDVSRDISRIVYTDSADAKATQLEITLNNKGNKYSDDPAFTTRNKIKLRWGYPNQVSPLYTFVMVKAEPSYNASTGPILKIVGWDKSIDMNRQARPYNWGPVSSSAVARKIAEKYNMRAIVEESDDARKESRVQAANDTDIQYLKKLADSLDWDCYVEGNALHFHKRRHTDTPTRTYDFMLGRNPQILEFSPRIKLNKKTASGKASADPKTGRSEAKTANQTDAPPLGKFLINADTLVSKYEGTAPATSSTPETSGKVVAKQAKAAQQKIDMSALEATAVIIGDPGIRSREPIVVRGVGIHSGTWYVKEATHDVTSDQYRTRLELQRNALEKGHKDAKGRRKAGRTEDTSLEDMRKELDALRVQIQFLERSGLKVSIPDKPPGLFTFGD